MEASGKLKTIDELDPAKNSFDQDDLTKFLSEFDHTYMDRSRPKGPDYLVIDNFVDMFDWLEQNDLIQARTEVEGISDQINGLEKDWVSARWDNLTWLKNHEESEGGIPGLKRIAEAMADLRRTLNDHSQAELGDKTLRVD